MVAVENKDFEEAKSELTEVIGQIDSKSLTTLVTHFAVQDCVGEMRIHWFCKKLKLLVGESHQVIQELKKTKIFRKARLNRSFESDILIDLDSNKGSKSITQPNKDVFESIVDGEVELKDLIGDENPIESSKSITNGQKKKRIRSKHHKIRKNENQKMNKKRKELLGLLK